MAEEASVLMPLKIAVPSCAGLSAPVRGAEKTAVVSVMSKVRSCAGAAPEEAVSRRKRSSRFCR